MEKGDFDGAEVSYRAALAIAPDSGGLLYNIGLAYQKREDCIDAEEWLRKAVAAQPTQPDFRLLLDNTVQARAYLERVAAGRVTPPNPTVALRAIKLARHPSRCQYLHAAMLYDWIFRKDPALANDLANGHRYEAARCAVPAAAGRDKEFPDLSAGERTRQAAQAMKWLRADLAQLTIDSHTPQRHPQIRQWLTRCKQDPDLAPIRDPAALAAMPADDRQAWQAFWREVDALLASIPE
jgi:tetratricopeptide (TPR) repeat protein